MNINYSTLFDSDLKESIYYLLGIRSLQDIRLLTKPKKNKTYSDEKDAILNTYNPILLCSALAASRVLKDDYKGYLKCFITRSKPNDFDLELLTLHDLKQDDKNILDVLELEIRCMEVFIDEIGLYLLANERINADSKYPPTIWDSYRCCWEALNGKSFNEKKSFAKQCYIWGAYYNDWIHKLRVYYEQGISDIDKLLNKLLSEPFNKQDFDSCIYVKKKFSLFVKRFYNLYYWNPLEIDAFATESKVAYLLNEFSRYSLSKKQEIKLKEYESRNSM